MVVVDAEQPPLTVGVMLERLSPLVLELVAAPHGVDVEARRVVILSPSDDVTLEAGDVALVVGSSATDEAFVDLLERAGGAGVALVVAKLAPDHWATAAACATTNGVALAVPPATSDWGQVFVLVRTLVETPVLPGDGDSGPSDLFALANAIAAAVGGATTIEDRELRVLAYSNLDQPIDDVRRDSILGRGVPRYVMARDDMVALYRRMFADGPVVHLPAEQHPPVRARMGVAVRAGDEVIGTIWAVQGDAPFDDVAERVLVGSTAHAALLLLQHQRAGDLVRRRRAEGVREALEGSTSSMFALAAGERLRVVALRVHERPDLDPASVVMRLRRLAEVASLQFEMLDGRSTAVDLDGVVLVIVPESARVTARRVRDVVADVVQRASHAFKRDVYAGIGSAVADVGGLAMSRWEAEETLASLLDDRRATSRSQVATIAEMQSDVVMRRVREVLADDLRCRTPHLDLLARHDAEHHTDHLATLGAYLDSFGDVSSAAARLDVHSNTLRYRLKRIDEIIGIDLADPVARFVLELQWRLR
jgi:DNA-binding PucR family transcriptional regulator